MTLTVMLKIHQEEPVCDLYIFSITIATSCQSLEPEEEELRF